MLRGRRGFFWEGELVLHAKEQRTHRYSFREEDATLTLPSSLHVSPGHDRCETVKVQLCASKEGLPVLVVAEDDFEFVQDEVYNAAQFLAASAGNQQALNFTRFLDRSGPPSADVNALDAKVALAFRHLKLPVEWNVLGTEQTLHGEHVTGPPTDGERGPLRFLSSCRRHVFRGG